MTMRPDGDYETTELRTANGVVRTLLRCLHRAEHVERVEAGGELVAYLCTDCDAQLPPHWRPGVRR